MRLSSEHHLSSKMGSRDDRKTMYDTKMYLHVPAAALSTDQSGSRSTKWTRRVTIVIKDKRIDNADADAWINQQVNVRMYLAYGISQQSSGHRRSCPPVLMYLRLNDDVQRCLITSWWMYAMYAMPTRWRMPLFISTCMYEEDFFDALFVFPFLPCTIRSPTVTRSTER